MEVEKVRAEEECGVEVRVIIVFVSKFAKLLQNL